MAQIESELSHQLALTLQWTFIWMKQALKKVRSTSNSNKCPKLCLQQILHVAHVTWMYVTTYEEVLFEHCNRLESMSLCIQVDISVTEAFAFAIIYVC